MRQRQKINKENGNYKILVVDDEVGVIDSLTVVLGRRGYFMKGTIDPLEAVEILREENFDLVVLDYLMSPIHGDEVVRRVREFNKEVYILLLTGHKDLAPPIETIRSLDIQGYCEKSDRFDQLILLVESGLKSIEQMKTVKKLKDGLSSILQVVPKIYKLQPIEIILKEILQEIPILINGKDAFITIEDVNDISNLNQTETRQFFAGIGNYENKTSIQEISDQLIKTNIERIKTESEIINMGDGIIIPLLSGIGKPMGSLYIEGNNIGKDTDIINIYVNQAATAINNALLHNILGSKNDELNETYNLLKDRYMDTIETLRLVVDAKDVYTRGHSDRVSDLACKMGEKQRLSDDDLEILRVGGLFHDVGKVGVADKILLKTSNLSAEEYEEIKKHPLEGSRILSGMSIFKDMIPLIEQHHERVDGRGYPYGLKGDSIHPLAKIIAVADAFDAMRSDRSYRSKLTVDETLKQLHDGKGRQFDGEVVDVFIDVLEEDEELFNIEV